VVLVGETVEVEPGHGVMAAGDFSHHLRLALCH
jgi:hypothetical protein